jgi:CheY-like chemotaxis protein
VLYIIRAFLEPLGYELATATSSVQAIETAGAEDFDLVLCDIGMPKHSGLDVCRLLRDAGYRGRFVLMTGWDSDSLRIDRRAADCDAMLKKPFAGADLIQAIDTLLAR